jgi:hypothetical protein
LVRKRNQTETAVLESSLQKEEQHPEGYTIKPLRQASNNERTLAYFFVCSMKLSQSPRSLLTTYRAAKVAVVLSYALKAQCLTKRLI